MQNRMARLKAALDEAGLDALILTKRANQRYLEGFTGGDCYMVVSGRGNCLVADSRYTELGERECRTAKVYPHRFPHPPFGEVITAFAKDNGFCKVGFERDHITWGQHEEIAKCAGPAGIELVPVSNLVEGIRVKKTPEEAALLASACQIADRALKDFLPCVKPGVSEMDLVTELEYRMKTGGSEEPAFDTMVLFGARASQPHATPRGDVRLLPGDLILIDYGACKGGYRSDTTRTFICGSASDEQKRAYEAVLRAQRASAGRVAPGANGRELNQISLDIIADAGLAGFAYSIGHGIGLEVHEEPLMRQKRDTILEADMILTIEPGTYKPGWGGIRIEDTLLVTEAGHRVLTHFPRELIEL